MPYDETNFTNLYEIYSNQWWSSSSGFTSSKSLKKSRNQHYKLKVQMKGLLVWSNSIFTLYEYSFILVDSFNIIMSSLIWNLNWWIIYVNYIKFIAYILIFNYLN